MVRFCWKHIFLPSVSINFQVEKNWNLISIKIFIAKKELESCLHYFMAQRLLNLKKSYWTSVNICEEKETNIKVMVQTYNLRRNTFILTQISIFGLYSTPSACNLFGSYFIIQGTFNFSSRQRSRGLNLRNLRGTCIISVASGHSGCSGNSHQLGVFIFHVIIKNMRGPASRKHTQ